LGLKLKFKTEVNLSTGLKPYFSVQIKVWFKTIVQNLGLSEI